MRGDLCTGPCMVTSKGASARRGVTFSVVCGLKDCGFVFAANRVRIGSFYADHVSSRLEDIEHVCEGIHADRAFFEIITDDDDEGDALLMQAMEGVEIPELIPA